jgi:RHS repeat-associated protein
MDNPATTGITEGFGLMFYNARWYDPYLNHFTQPDSIVPDPYNPQDWNRYSYARNNPLKYTDPDGHVPCQSGYRCVTPIADRRDLTTWLIAAAIDISNSSDMDAVREAKAIGSGALAWGRFINLVKDGGKYDVKDKILDEIGLDTKIGDNWYEYSTTGNILYGFYGKSVGFTEFELRAGAGAAQLADYNEDPSRGRGPCDLIYFCDTKDDYAAVGFGMHLYDNYYKDDHILTKVDLLNAFDTYPDSDKMALINKPKDYQPRYYEYPVDRFYQKIK